MNELSTTHAAKVWHFFSKICAIPHPSKHEIKLRDYLVSFANKRDLEHLIDDVGNLIVKKKATANCVNKPSIILQAHMDMVSQKDSNTNHDFLNDPIKTFIENGYLKAKGTTLGADNGIGLASILAVLDSTDIEHGAIEALFTINEEMGMDGAFGLKPGLLKSKLLINTDSEDEGVIIMGCAGGVDVNASLPMICVEPEEETFALNIAIKGLTGGHSGCDIHLYRANANIIALKFIASLDQKFDISVANLQGGTLRNAIPREAFFTLVAKKQDKENIKSFIFNYEKILKKDYKNSDENLHFSLDNCELPEFVFSTTSLANLLGFCLNLPKDVIRMSDEVSGVVETSSNLGLIRQKDGICQVQSLLRSLKDSTKQSAQEDFLALGKIANAKISFDNPYPGWAPDNSSRLMQDVQKNYKEIFNKEAKVLVMHAGLECGLFKTSYPDIDMVSFGPTIDAPHSPNENVEIASVDKYWKLLVKTLENLN